MFLKWKEAFTTSKQNTGAVAKALLTEISPHWGVPGKISSDTGTPFVNQALKQESKVMGFDRQHCTYHPASAGALTFCRFVP